MTNPPRQYLPIGLIVLLTLAAALAWTAQSWFRWSHFAYTTFDLAFYVQALDGFCAGRNWSSILGVPPFGNHADFIILLIWPVYAVFQHPLVPVIVQNLALAASFPLGWAIARRAGWDRHPAFFLAAALLLTPSLTFVALHEFHPEAFAVPLWLGIYHAWQCGRLRWFWLCCLLFLACKENLALVLAAWCGGQILFAKRHHREKGLNIWLWQVLPCVVSFGWLIAYTRWLSPMWNGGNVDFGALYSHLHERGLFQGTWHILQQSLRGNLVWALLLPLLALPLLRPLTLLPAAPILAQHLLSWRSSEWVIDFHYAAPLIPVFWLAALEVVTAWRERLPTVTRRIPVVLTFSSLLWWIGTGLPGRFLHPVPDGTDFLSEKRAAIAAIPPGAGVVAPLPMLHHLAGRPEVYSLHLLLKGLKTLSREPYPPPPAQDFIIVDYSDKITLDPASGYYHPLMRMRDGRTIPSSDVLLHQWLAKATWRVSSNGPVTVWERIPTAPPAQTDSAAAPVRTGLLDPGTDLLAITAQRTGSRGNWTITSRWRFRTSRTVIPWLTVVATHRTTGQRRHFVRGLCAPEGRADGTVWTDMWRPGGVLDENWDLQAVFEDHATTWFSQKTGQHLPGSDQRIVVPVTWPE